ncbi:hypothetical protein BC828DRAFT_128754 [Blastocladiella britannica]|nr:hypothetical protein BC828DRAFT_128754 [Blastocladiella britannica]
MHATPDTTLAALAATPSTVASSSAKLAGPLDDSPTPAGEWRPEEVRKRTDPLPGDCYRIRTYSANLRSISVAEAISALFQPAATASISSASAWPLQDPIKGNISGRLSSKAGRINWARCTAQNRCSILCGRTIAPNISQMDLWVTGNRTMARAAPGTQNSSIGDPSDCSCCRRCGGMSGEHARAKALASPATAERTKARRGWVQVRSAQSLSARECVRNWVAECWSRCCSTSARSSSGRSLSIIYNSIKFKSGFTQQTTALN